MPSLAPSIKPGITAMTKLLPGATDTTPNTGVKVVKWYAATSGFADDTLRMIEDLPTLGYPNNPTSANTFNSRFNQRSSPGSPFSAKVGTRLALV